MRNWHEIHGVNMLIFVKKLTVINLRNIFDAGDITYSSRQLITTYCPMDFHAYPFDTQKCNLEIESFGHTFDEIRFVYKIILFIINMYI